MLNRLTKLREERTEGDKGFTLIELLVVVVIIGILIAIAIPLYLNYQKGAKNKSAQSDVRNAVAAIQQCVTDNDNTLPANQSSTNNGDDLVFTCGASGSTTTQTAVASSGNKLAFAAVGTTGDYTITGVNKDTSKTYTYTSSTGKVTG